MPRQAADSTALGSRSAAPPGSDRRRLNPSIVLSRSTDRSKDGHRIVPAGARKSGVRASTGRLPSTRKTTRSPDCRPSASRTAFGTVTCPFDVTMGSSECLLHRCRTPPVPSHSVELLVAANPAEDSRLPYLIRLPVGAGLVFATSDVWPRTKALYCHRLDIADWPADPVVVDRVELRSCSRRARPSTSSPPARGRTDRNWCTPWRAAARWCSGRAPKRANSRGRACAPHRPRRRHPRAAHRRRRPRTLPLHLCRQTREDDAGSPALRRLRPESGRPTRGGRRA